jgi:hypothetical protein
MQSIPASRFHGGIQHVIHVRPREENPGIQLIKKGKSVPKQYDSIAISATNLALFSLVPPYSSVRLLK